MSLVYVEQFSGPKHFFEYRDFFRLTPKAKEKVLETRVLSR